MEPKMAEITLDPFINGVTSCARALDIWPQFNLKVIAAYCILHNICVAAGDILEEEEEGPGPGNRKDEEKSRTLHGPLPAWLADTGFFCRRGRGWCADYATCSGSQVGEKLLGCDDMKGADASLMSDESDGDKALYECSPKWWAPWLIRIVMSCQKVLDGKD
eukprot:superscaffoldBa00000071_g1115